MSHFEDFLLTKYDEWIDQDFFGLLSGSNQTKTIRHLIKMLSTDQGSFQLVSTDGKVRNNPALHDLNQTFSQLLASKIGIIPTEIIGMDQYMMKYCCADALPFLMTVVSQELSQGDMDKLLGEDGPKDVLDFFQQYRTGEEFDYLCRRMFERLVQRLADRTLLSFFIISREPDGFYTWHPDMATNIGEKLKPYRKDIDGRTMVVEVSRYEEVEGPVTGYEWNAYLNGASTKPDAVACGMVYVFERDDGAPLGGMSELADVADSVADIDVLQIEAFFKQHPDAQSLLQKSDLCFVSSWERRADADKGCGKVLLEAAIAHLSKRFKKVKTVVLESSPQQFNDWGKDVDPAMVEAAKQDALDGLSRYIAALNVTGTTFKYIFTRFDDADESAKRALNRLHSLASRNGDGEDNDLEGIIDNVDQIPELLRLAGLDELATDMEDGAPDEANVMRVLVELFIHRRVPYLPATFVPQERAAQQDQQGVSFEDLPDDISERLAYFADTLPADIEVRGIYLCEDMVLRDWIVVVTSATIFGELVGYFTLARAPGNLDVGRYLR